MSSSAAAIRRLPSPCPSNAGTISVWVIARVSPCPRYSANPASSPSTAISYRSRSAASTTSIPTSSDTTCRLLLARPICEERCPPATSGWDEKWLSADRLPRCVESGLAVGVERRAPCIAQARQHAVQLLTLVSGQCFEEGVFGFAELLVGLGQPTLAGGRDRHDVTSSVVGVSLAFDQPCSV